MLGIGKRRNKLVTIKRGKNNFQEVKEREQRMLAEYTELEEENINLQKTVSAFHLVFYRKFR